MAPASSRFPRAGLALGVAVVLALPSLLAAAERPIPDAALRACKSLNEEDCKPLAELIAEGAPAGELALRMLASDDLVVRRAGARFFARVIDPTAGDSLAALLGHPDVDVRTDCLAGLATSGGRQHAAAVLDMLSRETERGPRVAAFRALGRLGAPNALEPLLAALPQADVLAGEAILDSLGLLRDARAVLPVATLLADPRVHPALHLAAVKGLAAIGDRSAVPALLQATGSAEPEVRREAILALGHVRATVATELLVELLSDDEVLEPAVRALAALDDPRALPPLLTILRADDLPVEVRQAVLETFGRRKATEVVPELLVMVSENPPGIMPELLRTLGQIGDERALSRLIEALDQPDPAIKWAANSALGAITGQKFGPEPAAWTKWLTERNRPTDDEEP